MVALCLTLSFMGGEGARETETITTLIKPLNDDPNIAL